MYIVRQLLQNELEDSDSRPLIRISRTRSEALQIPFPFMAGKCRKNRILTSNLMHQQDLSNQYMPYNATLEF